MLGKKTGGRKKGTPNRKTMDVAEQLEALHCRPIVGLARIAMNRKNPMELRARTYGQLAEFIYPKRRAVEASGAIALTYEMVGAIDMTSLTDDDLAQIRAGKITAELLARMQASARSAADTSESCTD